MSSRYRDRNGNALRKQGPAIIFLSFFLFAILPGVYGMEKGDPARGKEAFKKRNCSMCHTLNGKGGDIGPDLTRVKERRSDDWLMKWLKDPPSIKPETIMPKMKWESDQEILDVIYYLKDPG